MMSRSTKQNANVSQRMVLLSAIFAMAVLLLGVSSSATTMKAWAQASSSGGDIKTKAKDVENTVISALKSYATAIGAKYIELDLLNSTQVPSSNATQGGVPTVVNQTAYSDAQNMIAKAQSQLQALSQSANPQQAMQIAKVQGGLESFKTLVERKAAFNLVEDIVQSPIVNNLRQLS